MFSFCFCLFSLCFFVVLPSNSTVNCVLFLLFAFYPRRDSFNSTLVAHILVWGSHKPYLSSHPSSSIHNIVPVHFFCVTCSAFRIPWHNSHLVPCHNTVETPRQTGQKPISRMHEVPRSPERPQLPPQDVLKPIRDPPSNRSKTDFKNAWGT